MSPSFLVDTTFVPIQQPHLEPWEYYNKNKNSFGLLYEVCVSLGRPFRLLSFRGPFKGAASDVTIFRDSIMKKMRYGEKAMADKAYRQEKEYVWCPPEGKMSGLNDEQKAARRRVTVTRHLVERAIGRIKSWGFMNRKWKGKIFQHKLASHVIARLTQLDLYAHPLT